MTGNAGTVRLQQFGVILGSGRVVIYVEPKPILNKILTSNTARTQLLIDGEPLPWNEWAAEFRQNLPQEIKNLIDEVASGSLMEEVAAADGHVAPAPTIGAPASVSDIGVRTAGGVEAETTEGRG